MKLKTVGIDIQHSLDYLARFSLTSSKAGVSRLPWTLEDAKAVESLKDVLTEMGLNVSVDSANNLWGVWDVGANKSIVIGSHRDSVPNGGTLDGALGVMGAIEVIRQLKATHYKPHHNIEVVAWNDEEGARFGTTLFGSRIYTGAVSPSSLGNKKDGQSISIDKAISNVMGYGLDEMIPCNLSRILAYIELHIEQGPILELNNCQIGVVSRVNAQFRKRISVHGVRVHGAYSGFDRIDPIFGSAQIWSYLQSLIEQSNEDSYYPQVVATIGQIDVASHLINAVPPDITWSLDIRSNEVALAQEVISELESYIDNLSKKVGFLTEIEKIDDHAVLAGVSDVSRPIVFDAQLQNIICQAAKDNHYSYQIMPSWAGHDAMAMAPRVPTAMIFVPSHKGLSHTPEEWTAPEELARGVDVLRDSVVNTDEQ